MKEILLWSLFFALALYLLFKTFYFFIFLRDNKNNIPKGKNIVSPASGKIIFWKVITPKSSTLSIKKGLFGAIKTHIQPQKKYIVINIFMNVFDVHFTKAPLDGTITNIIRTPGKFRSTTTFERPLENEKQIFSLKTSLGEVQVIQIAGLLARKCVSFVCPNMQVKKGAKLGQILLGSQVCLILPFQENLIPRLKVGDRVSAGESILFDIT